MINSDMLKTFEPDDNTISIISKIAQTSECNQDCVKFKVTQVNKEMDEVVDDQAIERMLTISSELDIDENGLYKTELTGYDNSLKNTSIQSSLKTGSVEYTTENNSLEENTGVTIQNINLNTLEAYYIRLKDYGESLLCGNIIDYTTLELKKEHNNVLVVIDFAEVKEVSRNFLETYTKFLLKTSNKVITINMSVDISNDFDMFILTNILEVEE